MTGHAATPDHADSGDGHTHAAHSTDHGGGVAVAELDFDRREMAQFDADDTQAGSAIGKMLALFFFYTVLAMSFVSWWTFRAVVD